ncbi:hypothetical protein Clacol_001208 [Clathrus columnatus]|uniref:FAD dependent oxidoreductase domain-containing protein n=1 Tax=Clathrus columnatus TaxID=1419009 RepID=A0AAV5A1X2_9AGAM|nr:hypothetical protein Clacol_001208 [Clathrus columnatus]
MHIHISQEQEQETFDPRYPHPNPSISFWLQGTRSSPLLGFRSKNFPESADVVIIGSGLSGASTAYFLLEGENAPQNIVMLEARDVCSGATGRNGGHCKPDCYKDVAMNQSAGDVWLGALAEYIADGADVEGIVEWISDPEEAKKLSRCRHAHAVARIPAGSLWPFKLASGLLEICIKRHNLNLQTTTPVIAVRRPANSKHDSWIVETERGNIIAKKVVFASNGFTATLLPEFKDKITPVRGQCCAIIPTKPFSGPDLLKETYSFRWGAPLSYLDYMIQRPKDGTIILGGGRSQVTLESQIDQTDDSAKDPAVPYVGPVHGKPGLFINAGHSGYGTTSLELPQEKDINFPVIIFRDGSYYDLFSGNRRFDERGKLGGYRITRMF